MINELLSRLVSHDADADLATKKQESIKNMKNILSTIKKTINPNFENGPWVAGGLLVKSFFIDTFDNNRGDVDIFCSSQEQIDVVTSKLEKLLKGNLKYEFCDNVRGKLRLNGFIHETVGATTYKISFPDRSVDIQIIKQTFFSLEALLDDFDFTCCRIATDFEDVVMSEETMYDLENKILRLDGPVTKKTLSRFFKYMYRYDFTPTKETIRKIHQFYSDNGWDFSPSGVY